MNLSTLVLVLLSIKATVLLCNMIHMHHYMWHFNTNKPVVKNPASFANVTNSSRSPPPNIIKKNNTRFNNSDSKTNGEFLFYTIIKPHINCIFDVGCRDSDFIDFEGEVHYFDPVHDFIEKLSKQPNRNKKAYLIALV